MFGRNAVNLSCCFLCALELSWVESYHDLSTWKYWNFSQWFILPFVWNFLFLLWKLWQTIIDLEICQNLLIQYVGNFAWLEFGIEVRKSIAIVLLNIYSRVLSVHSSLLSFVIFGLVHQNFHNTHTYIQFRCIYTFIYVYRRIYYWSVWLEQRNYCIPLSSDDL